MLINAARDADAVIATSVTNVVATTPTAERFALVYQVEASMWRVSASCTCWRASS